MLYMRAYLYDYKKEKRAGGCVTGPNTYFLIHITFTATWHITGHIVHNKS